MKSLFERYELGNNLLQNRIVMAPMTRARALDEHADDLTARYYSQRASAGLIITEGTPISAEASGYLYTPGIFRPSQINAWKPVTKGVHARQGKLFAQLWHVGRVSHTSLQPEGKEPVSSVAEQGGNVYAWDSNGRPNNIPASPPRMLDIAEIPRLVNDFRQAARNAIDAGFDGVELHAANGYLLEQFINPVLNTRKDKYGGRTLESRSRLLLEVVDALNEEIGPERVGIRLSPCNQLYDMPLYPDINDTYLYIADALSARNSVYVHLMAQGQLMFNGFLRQFRQAYTGTLILAGGLTAHQAAGLIESNLIDLAAFGSPFIANPDFVERLKNGWPLTPADHSTFYGGGETGYTDYPAYGEC